MACCKKNQVFSTKQTRRLLPVGKQDKNMVLHREESDFIIIGFGVLPYEARYRTISLDVSKRGVTSLACGAEHFILLTGLNEILTCGNNEFGQCAQPIRRDTREVRLARFTLDGFWAQDVAAGAYHSLIKAVRANEDGQLVGVHSKVLGFGHEIGLAREDRQHQFEPQLLEIPSKAHDYHWVYETQEENQDDDELDMLSECDDVVIDQKDVYEVDSENEQMGGEGEIMKDPDFSVSNIFAGQNRSAIVLESGRILMWGEWFNGAKKRRMTCIKMPNTNDSKVTKITMGKFHALALTQVGNVYSWGDNTYGELGQSRNVKGSDTPIKIEGLSNVQDIASGARHSLVLTAGGRLYSFGDNSEGQCGIDINRVWEPQEISLQGVIGEDRVKAKRIWAGDAHSALITTDGDMFAWGDNSVQRLGIKSSASIFKPTLVEDLIGRNISHIGLGGFFTMAIVGPADYSMLQRELRGTRFGIQRMIENSILGR